MESTANAYTAQGTQEGSNTENTGDGGLTGGRERVAGANSASVETITSSETPQVGGQLVETRSGRILPTKDHTSKRLEET